MLPESYYLTCFEIEATPLKPESDFAIVTAYNPQDRPCSVATNVRADENLYAQLVAAGFAPFRATGGSPDWSHKEPGWGFETTFEVGLEIAMLFDQRAFWWIEKGRLNLVDCSTPIPVHIARFADRIMLH